MAVHLHTNEGRDSRDIDFVVERNIPDDELITKGYKKTTARKQPWSTPRDIKIDIYSGDIPGVSHDWIVRNAAECAVGSKRALRTLGLESLIVAKYTANREQDIEDLVSIARRRYSDIDWSVIGQITDQFKASLIRRDVDLLYRNLR